MTKEEKLRRLRLANRKWRKNHPELAKKLNRESAACQRRNDPERMVANIRKAKYNVTREWFDAKMIEQKRKCAICRKEEIGTYRGKIKSLAVDHDHSCCSGKKSCGRCVRGLLCQRCNRALGMLLESIPILKNAIRYLRKYNGRRQ
jgi:Recombination endonuclease VII